MAKERNPVSILLLDFFLNKSGETACLIVTGDKRMSKDYDLVIQKNIHK